MTSCTVIGLSAAPVQVEVDIATGLERVTLVGLPDAAMRESSERVGAALTNSVYWILKNGPHVKEESEAT